MHCYEKTVNYFSWMIMLVGLAHLINHKKAQTAYGRYMTPADSRKVPAKLAWFLQELPALLTPILLVLFSHHTYNLGKYLLLTTFCLHYFQRTFIYSLLNRGQPFPVKVMVAAGFFCFLNGFLQGYYLLHCANFDDNWSTTYCYKIGLLVFYTGMAINIHSDHKLRNLRNSNELDYKIPTGGLFEYVSGANYFGEIVEWFGYALATMSIPTFSFAVFSLCFIGPRAYYHHRFYQKKFETYPKFRKALIPFIF